MERDKSKDKQCEYTNLKRARYFHGMLMTERDFREEQMYHNEKRRLSNRMIHGWGVVCGLGITATSPESSKIVITPGMALDCLGNEIVVCNSFEVDLKKLPELCPDTSKREKDICAETDTSGECKYYVAIKFAEVPTDPVPVYAPGGSCEEKTCEYSRITEGFCVNLFKSPPCQAALPKDILTVVIECLKKYTTKEEQAKCVSKALEDFQKSFCDQPYPCPTCCCTDEPYVVLGTVDFKTTNCKVTTIKQNMISIHEGRRYVMTPMFWEYILGSFSNAVVSFLDNPFIMICRLLDLITEQLPKAVETPAIASRVETFKKMTAVNKMNEEQARAEIAKQNLVYNSTVVLTPEKAASLAGRAISIEKIEPATRVDLVTDKQGKVLFYMPVAEAREKVDVDALRKEMDAKVADISKQNAADLKKMETTYQKKLDELNKTIKELGTRIGK